MLIVDGCQYFAGVWLHVGNLLRWIASKPCMWLCIAFQVGWANFNLRIIQNVTGSYFKSSWPWSREVWNSLLWWGLFIVHIYSLIYTCMLFVYTSTVNPDFWISVLGPPLALKSVCFLDSPRGLAAMWLLSLAQECADPDVIPAGYVPIDAAAGLHLIFNVRFVSFLWT